MTHFSDGELQAYLDGELKPDRTRGMKGHLLACSKCMEALNQLDIAGRVTNLCPDRAGHAAAAGNTLPLLVNK